MSLDLLDAAFVRRVAVRAPRPRPPAAEAPRPRPEPPAPAVKPVPAQPTHENTAAVKPVPVQPVPVEPVREPPVIADPMVARLLAGAPGQWDALAGHVEAARHRGRRVIAIAGGRAGEGRTTLVGCLAATLRARGREVACAGPHDLAAVAGGPDGRGPTHDKRIILVDAGIWFPPGPIRRAVLQVASLGCEAAILVRRAGTTGGGARQGALEALGIEVLGEVLTFTAPGADDGDDVTQGGRAA